MATALSPAKVFPSSRRSEVCMNPYREPTCLGNGCQGRTVLKRSESEDLDRLADLVARVFRAPVAYIAMRQPPGNFSYRTGSGKEYWEYIETLPAYREAVAPVVMQGLPSGDGADEPGFWAIAPIYTLCRKRLGTLAIADREARPGFSAQDLRTLEDLAGVIAGRIEMRIIASQALGLNQLYLACSGKTDEAVPGPSRPEEILQEP